MSVTVLLLRLAGPLQSWGDRPAIDKRVTGSVPTKSGVVGLVAAALGMERGEDLSELCALKMGVRVEQRGKLLMDFHTVSSYEWIGPNTLQPKSLPNAEVNASGLQKARTGKGPMTTIPTRRYYLQDAVFLVGLQGEADFLVELDEAVRAPRYPLALGRRSCPPAGRVSLGIRSGASLEVVLREEPWRPGEAARQAKRREFGEGQAEVELAFVLEDEHGDELVRDVPVSFAPMERSWSTRAVRHELWPVPSGLEPLRPSAAETVAPAAPAVKADHDPLGWWTE